MGCKMMFTIINYLTIVLSFDIVLRIASNDIDIKIDQKPLRIYWNVPSFQCDPFKLNFSEILEKYNVIQNHNARFRGEELVILYDPGKFPAILKNGDEIFLRNGGVPQEGNLTTHLELFTLILTQLIPEKNFSGIGIIDFESWMPIYRQNWATLQPYQALSEYLVKQDWPFWPLPKIREEATRRFEYAAKIFLDETLQLAKYLRPEATWGFYHYPYCFNKGHSIENQCGKEVLYENDRISWLFNRSDALYPSVYLQQRDTVEQHVRLIEKRVDEAIRVKKNLDSDDKKIYVYYWYKYQDTKKYLSKVDLLATLRALASYEIDGVILWGASADVNSKATCLQLYDYMDQVFGPIIRIA